jgi:hypothetical protein
LEAGPFVASAVFRQLRRRQGVSPFRQQRNPVESQSQLLHRGAQSRMPLPRIGIALIPGKMLFIYRIEMKPLEIGRAEV